MAWTLSTIESRALKAGLACIALAVLMYLISISTPYWIRIDIPTGSYRNATQGYVMRHHSGLWRICRTELHNATKPAFERE